MWIINNGVAGREKSIMMGSLSALDALRRKMITQMSNIVSQQSCKTPGKTGTTDLSLVISKENPNLVPAYLCGYDYP